MESLTRRDFMAMAAAVPLIQAPTGRPAAGPGSGGLFVSIHGASVTKSDFRAGVEGIAKAGVKAVEPEVAKVQQFAQLPGESLVSAKKLLDDLGLKAVSTSNHLGLPDAAAAQVANMIESLKPKLEVAQAIGADRIVCPSTGSGTKTADDYKRAVDTMRQAGDVAKPYGVLLMIEFARTSTLIGSLPTCLKVVREANHPNVRAMMDTFHFWGGISKFEDLELLKDGELAHLHFEDIPDDPPREGQGQPNRVFPGDGIVPLKRIVQLLKQKKYSGPASLEMFQGQSALIGNLSPYEVAMKARMAIEPIIS
jgi:sugar phosphate isomerase/epimerase